MSLSSSECRRDDTTDPEWGTTTVRVCLPGEIGDCGPGIVCFLADIPGEDVGTDSAFSVSGTFTTALDSGYASTSMPKSPRQR